jgi:uncharacterized membrane protein
MEETKVWYASKTMWVNLIGAIAILLQTQTGFVIDVEAQAALLAVINLVLRAITKEAVSLHKE